MYACSGLGQAFKHTYRTTLYLERIGVHPKQLVEVVGACARRSGEKLQPSHLVGQPHA